MKTYHVTFMRLQGYSQTVQAEDSAKAMAAAVAAYYADQLRPDYAHLDYFEAEPQEQL